MFATLDDARAELQKLSVDQLMDLTVLTMQEYLLGNITERQAAFVSHLIEEETLRRVGELFLAELEKETATIN